MQAVVEKKNERTKQRKNCLANRKERNFEEFKYVDLLQMVTHGLVRSFLSIWNKRVCFYSGA